MNGKGDRDEKQVKRAITNLQITFDFSESGLSKIVFRNLNQLLIRQPTINILIQIPRNRNDGIRCIQH